MQPLLEFRNLTVDFITKEQTTRAVNNVSFVVNKGETVGIVGESGSGKSVTSLSAMGLIPQPPGKISNGEIIFHKNESEQVNLLSLNDKEMNQYRGNDIAMIFQEPMTSLNPVYTCGNQVMEALMLHQKLSKTEAKAKTIELFKMVQLPRPEEMVEQYPHQLSGGQKQRVMIAMAMSCNPHVLIADEPTTALDVTVQKTILDLMQQLQQENEMGIIFITHDLGVIAELADRVVVMYKGNVVEEGPVKEIFTNPKHPYTKGLIACRPPLKQRYTKLPTVPDFMEELGDGEVKEKVSSIEEFINELVVPSSVREERHKKLYEQEPILQVKNLKTYFPLHKNFFGRTESWVKAVDDVTFDVYPGETLGLIGESGCGKTTIGRTIIKLIEHSDGEVYYKGKNVFEMDKEELAAYRREVQIIFQDPYSSLNPRKTVGNAIVEPMKIHKLYASDAERKAKAIELLERVNLKAEHFNRYPHEFSGGQRQRICIARTLAMRPKFIICDESVSALDVSVQAQVLNLLNELKEDFGFTYIFISHDLSVVKFMCDRMVVMNQMGKIERLGDCDEVYANPGSEYTQNLIDAIPKGAF